MSNEAGKGWVELEFPIEQEITRVVWSRDREGKLEDRMPTEYRIEIGDGEAWKLVADSTDRRPFVAGAGRGPDFTTAGLTPDETKEANRLLEEKRSLEVKMKEIEGGQLAFAGTFRKPDEIHVLARGDPEQPKEEVFPAVLGALGTTKLPNDADEQQRRRSIADWIASPRNPLTARVMMNRIWQGHFGTGLVESEEDFGTQGDLPSHPELLDWLAHHYQHDLKWNTKALIKLILMSNAYRQSSKVTSQHMQLDPRNTQPCSALPP
jgi:hypothetical protein